MRRRTLSALRHDRAAMVTLDFALIVVPLFMLIFGTFEFGRLLWIKQALQMTAVAGARCIGVLASSCTSGAGAYNENNTKSYIEGVASNWGISLVAADVVATDNATSGLCSGKSSHIARVTINYTFTTVVPGLLTAIAGDVALTGKACFSKQAVG